MSFEPELHSPSPRRAAVSPAAWAAEGSRISQARLRSTFQRLPITCFVLMTFAWTWSCWFFLVRSGLHYDLRIWKYVYVAGLSGPLFAAMSITLTLEGMPGVWRLAKRALIWRFSPVWLLLGILLVPLLMLGAIGIYEMAFQKSIELPRPTLWAILISFGWMIVRGGAANEELGWRGFLLPRLLSRYNMFWASLILIPIWAVWHGPLWLLPGLPHKHWPFGYFLMILAPLTFLFTWLHTHSGGSVLLAILFHAAINTGIHFLPMLPPRHRGLAPFALWIGLTWAITLLVLWVNRANWFSRSPGAQESATKSANQ